MKTSTIDVNYFETHDFWDKVDVLRNPWDCWLWTKGRHQAGYGQAYDGVGNRRAHRVAYTLCRGVIPPGLVIDHLCRTPACCNPKHLRAVTQKQNADGHQHKTHCTQGHEYTGGNVYTRPNGHRECVACGRSYKARKRAAK